MCFLFLFFFKNLLENVGVSAARRRWATGSTWGSRIIVTIIRAQRSAKRNRQIVDGFKRSFCWVSLYTGRHGNGSLAVGNKPDRQPLSGYFWKERRKRKNPPTGWNTHSSCYRITCFSSVTTDLNGLFESNNLLVKSFAFAIEAVVLALKVRVLLLQVV